MRAAPAFVVVIFCVGCAHNAVVKTVSRRPAASDSAFATACDAKTVQATADGIVGCTLRDQAVPRQFFVKPGQRPMLPDQPELNLRVPPPPPRR
jgi:hypothetical protein